MATLAGLSSGTAIQSSQSPIVDPQSGIPTPEFYKWMLAFNQDRPAFSVNLGGVDVTVPYSLPYNKLEFTNKEFDTTNSFNIGAGFRFHPRVPGMYIINCGVGFLTLGDGGVSVAAIYRNEEPYKAGLPGASGSPNFSSGAFVSSVVPLNGASDYVDFRTAQFNTLGNSRTLISATNVTFASGIWISPLPAGFGSTGGVGGVEFDPS